MGFVSVTFFLFAAATLFFYFAVPLKRRWVVLLLASICFYIWAGWEKILFVLAAAFTAYKGAIEIGHIYACQEKDAKAKRRKAKKVLFLCAGILLLMLAYTKTAQELAGFLFGEKAAECVIIPLGVSYYTFSVLGYLADVYWKKDEAEQDFFKLLLYMIYFPQIVQGPIPRRHTLAPSLLEGHAFHYKDFCYGLQRALWGYFKKMVIADRLALLTTEVFTNYLLYEGIVFAIAAAASAVQLYCDFSGCMDIVIGISECMSIKLEENFKTPFFSKSAAEFWRRWHITLGAWFKDYVYMPLVISPSLAKLSRRVKGTFGKRPAKAMMTALPLAVVWILTGVWHGTGFTYIAWGCWWGNIIIFSDVCAPEIKKLHRLFHVHTASVQWQAWQSVRTFLLFCIGRLLTAPGDLKVTAWVIKQMLSKWNAWILFDETLYQLGMDRKDFWVALFAVCLLLFVEYCHEKGLKIRDRIAAFPLVFRWPVYYLGFFAVVVFGMYGSGHAGNTFVYMNY